MGPGPDAHAANAIATITSSHRPTSAPAPAFTDPLQIQGGSNRAVFRVVWNCVGSGSRQSDGPWRLVGVSVGRIHTEPEPTDAEIIFESLENPERFREIFRRHYDMIFRFTAKRVGRDLAADLSADVFVRAFQVRTRYDLTRPLCRPWLYGIASNVVGDHLRRRQVGLRAALVVLSETADVYAVVDDRVVSQSQAAALYEAVSKLRRSDRDVLLLYALEELSYGEIAESLAVPIGTVRSRLARARRRMRELLPEFAQTTDRNGEAEGE